MTTMYVCMTVTGMDADSSAKGLLVSINLPQSWAVIFKAGTEGMASANSTILANLMRRRFVGRATSGKGHIQFIFGIT
jgi:hypothetical protein